MHIAQRCVCKQSVCFSHASHTVRQVKASLSNRSVQQIPSVPGRSRLRTYKSVGSVIANSSRDGSIPAVTQPWSSSDVDRDLWAVLDLASDEELEGVYDMLFGEQLCSQFRTGMALRS